MIIIISRNSIIQISQANPQITIISSISTLFSLIKSENISIINENFFQRMKKNNVMIIISIFIAIYLSIISIIIFINLKLQSIYILNHRFLILILAISFLNTRISDYFWENDNFKLL